MAVLACGAAAVISGFGQERQQEIRKYTAFFCAPGRELDEDNEIKQEIAKITGAECEELWLVGQTADQAISSYIAGGEYPDFIEGGVELYQAGALLPIDEYWDAYPNIRNYYLDSQWELLRQEDGHIYWIPQFDNQKNESKDLLHKGEAFWVQTRVLKWAGYPEVRTLEEYFDLLESYTQAHPGEEVIPYTILCDDWRYFCLENPPQFLDGYPNDGSCMVDADTLEVKDYNVTPTAEAYFRKLNEEYQKGIIDPEFCTQTYAEYLEKLSSGQVLGMVDQWWQFYYDIYDVLDVQGQGRNYVPLPITIDRSVKNQWHVKEGSEITISEGISVTVSCEDAEGALQFLNDLMDEEVQKLRFWGIEGVDYEVDENGVFYQTKEQQKLSLDATYTASHFCLYSYFPRLEGTLEDGQNAFSPEYQPEIFFSTLQEDVKECLEAYGCQSYADMLGVNDAPGDWYPMYTHSALLTADTEAGAVWKKMTQTKQEQLPLVVMSEDFDTAWENYLEKYYECQPEVFLRKCR